MDNIAIEHSVVFKGRFRIVAVNSPKQLKNVTTRGWEVILRDNLSMIQATRLAAEVRKTLNCKLTSEDCSYCSGIGGCYMCDS